MVFSKRNRKYHFHVVKVWENLKKPHVETLAYRLVFLEHFLLESFHSCFYNLIETQNMFSNSLMDMQCTCMHDRNISDAISGEKLSAE